jgi:hypothetical protein
MKKAIISETANNQLIEYIHSLGLEIKRVPNYNGTLIGTHADLYYCQLSINYTNAGIQQNHNSDNHLICSNIFAGDKNLVGKTYPEDCIYNAACTGKHFIHNTKITNPLLLNTAQKLNINVINVNQGYAKCNCVVVDEHSIITSDSGIARKCKGVLDCLLISPGNVLLKGFRYGFLGGSSGRIEDEIIFNGDIYSHPDHISIINFIEHRHLHVSYIPDYPLTDIGSILFTE